MGIKIIYEDNLSSKLCDDRFAKMSRRYEDEQKELAEKIKKLRSEIEKQSGQVMTTDRFISWGANTPNIRHRVFVSDASIGIFE